MRYKGRVTAIAPRVTVGRSAYVSLNDAALDALGRPKYVTLEYIDRYGARIVLTPSSRPGLGHLKVAYTPNRTTGRIFFRGATEKLELNLEYGSFPLTIQEYSLIWKLTRTGD